MPPDRPAPCVAPPRNATDARLDNVLAWPVELFHLDDPARVDEPTLQTVLDYWRARRVGDRLPRRADINPIDLRSCIGGLFLIDVLPSVAEFRFRLLGTDFPVHLGRDSTGRKLGECFTGKAQRAGEWLRERYRTAVLQRVPVLTRAPLVQVDKAHVQVRAIHLPLAGADGRVNMLFGAAVFNRA